MFKKVIGLVLCCMLICGLCVGCGESPEERQQRIVSGVQNKFALLVSEDPEVEAVFSMMTDKEWYYYIDKENDIEYVELSGTVTYFISMPINIKFYIDQENGQDYICKLEGVILGEYDCVDVPFSDVSVLQ